jgi:hypothetical protein
MYRRLSLYCLMIFSTHLFGYHLPELNLGLTNFLDGGPIRPAPGWYWSQYMQYYHTQEFLDGQGNLLGDVLSPEYNGFGFFTDLAYQHAFNGFEIGVDMTFGFVLVSDITCNTLGFTSSGGGLIDFSPNIYLQFDPIFHNERPIFVHRLSFGVTFPTGKNKLPCKTINPGNRHYYLDPYWAATLYCTRDFSLSWRIYYVWSAKNYITNIQAGDATLLNFSAGYQFTQRLYAGLNGYFVQQFHDDKLAGVKVPNSRERVLGLGPGMVYFADKEWFFFFHFYAEGDVRNRPKGINIALSFIKHF